MSKHPVAAYIHGVLGGVIQASSLIRLAVERHVRDLETAGERGFWFDRQAAEHAIRFFGFLRHSKGEWANQPFTLEPWQQFIVWVVFGWRRPDGFRRFRTAYIEVPRKNGKTTLVAGIGLYLLTADGEPGAEVYSAATKRDQAKLSWSEAVRMRTKSPALAKMVQHWRSSDTLTVEATASKFQPLGADADTMDGLNVHGALIDELHAHKTRAVVDVLETATGARRQPLILEITTAGVDQQSVCYEHHEYSERVLKGTVTDDTWFAFIATLDEGDDWTDETVWAKANPNLNVSVKIDDLRRKCERAKQLPSAQNAFRRLHLNEWTQQVDRWIDLTLWDSNAGEHGARELEEVLRGQPCHGGLDLSAVSDLTAWVLVFPREEDPEEVDILCRFWCPEARLQDAQNRYRDQYQAWARDGWLEVTSGDAVDYAHIRARVLADAERYRLVDLNVDRLFQGYQLSQELADEGLTVFGMGQGFISMAAPMREFERRLLDHKLHHGGHPVLRFMAESVAVRRDPADNLKVDKAGSQGRVDGIVALVMALDRAMRRETPRRSVYEDRGLEVV
jgi:phage terminase large subunit-like protein